MQHELRTANENLIAHRQQIEAHERELREINVRLHTQATRDPLTGLRNRRAMIERFNEESDRARRRHEPLSLALMDVDNFKISNDSFGHPAGDLVLQEVARLLENHARVSDLVARYDGEEFVLLLPATDVAAARLIAERVREAIAGASWPNRLVTTSVGIATFVSTEPSPNEIPVPAAFNSFDKATIELTSLLGRADAALYASKKAGRNRCCHANDLLVDS